LPGFDRLYNVGQTLPAEHLQLLSTVPGPTKASNKKLVPGSTKSQVLPFAAPDYEAVDTSLYLT
jgi:hypothetical protein